MKVDSEITELGEDKRFVRTEYEGYGDVFSTRGLHRIANSLKSRVDDEDILRKIDDPRPDCYCQGCWEEVDSCR